VTPRAHTPAEWTAVAQRCEATLRGPDACTDGTELSWRMVAILHWWLRQMLAATGGRQGPLMQVLTDTMNDVGIQVHALPLEAPKDAQ
jgi:hypothetical protein